MAGIVGTDQTAGNIGGAMNLLSIAQAAERLQSTPRELVKVIHDSPMPLIRFQKQGTYRRIDERDLPLLKKALQQARQNVPHKSSILEAKLKLLRPKHTGI